MEKLIVALNLTHFQGHYSKDGLAQSDVELCVLIRIVLCISLSQDKDWELVPTGGAVELHCIAANSQKFTSSLMFKNVN